MSEKVTKGGKASGRDNPNVSSATGTSLHAIDQPGETCALHYTIGN